ncbi:MAG TPA: NAD kinase [Candidatus Lustribacter sp.]|nr:NAD kinase [Candidatus Lustribacter sp.]
MTRRIMLVSHPRRPDVAAAAREVTARFQQAGIEVLPAPDEVWAPDRSGIEHLLPGAGATGARDCELVCVLGGDGTILRGAELTRGSETPLLGVNLGHVGFLAEVEREDLAATVEHIARRRYTVEERMTLEVVASVNDQTIARSWALNEVSVEKAARERMIEVAVEIDGRPLSTWGCDGVVMATPTGSTAYAFSAGGPVVWPDVEAILLVPNAAHALFARPLVVGPNSRLAIELIDERLDGDPGVCAVMWCDGRRYNDLPGGARVEVTRSDTPVHLAHLDTGPFTDRIVAKFALSVQGWRGAARGQAPRGT